MTLCNVEIMVQAARIWELRGLMKAYKGLGVRGTEISNDLWRVLGYSEVF